MQQKYYLLQPASQTGYSNQNLTMRNTFYALLIITKINICRDEFTDKTPNEDRKIAYNRRAKNFKSDNS